MLKPYQRRAACLDVWLREGFSARFFFSLTPSAFLVSRHQRDVLRVYVCFLFTRFPNRSQTANAEYAMMLNVDQCREST